MQQIEIAGRPIGPGHPCFIIAEAGVNHNGDPDLALQLVDAAVEAGADAICLTAAVASAPEPEAAAANLSKIIEEAGG